MQRLERIHLLSSPCRLKPMRELLRTRLMSIECAIENIDYIVMAINEACMNVIQHAFNGNDQGEIIVELWLDNKQLLVRLEDDAQPIDCSSIHPRNIDDVRPGGLGVFFIEQIMDQVNYSHLSTRQGNALEMKVRLDKSIKLQLRYKDKMSVNGKTQD